MKRLILTALASLIVIMAGAQQNKVDSLLNALKTAKQDTNKVNILMGISDESMDNESVFAYAQQALILSEKLNFKKGMASAYNNIAFSFEAKGKIEDALENYMKALRLCEQTGYKSGVATCLNNIGVLYEDLGQTDNSLEYHNKALKIQEEMGDEDGIATSLNNIGSIWGEKGQLEKEIDYLTKASTIYEQVGDAQGIATSLNGIANVFERKKQFKEALKYCLKALKIFDRIGDQHGFSSCLNHIGNIYLKQNDLVHAELYCSRSLAVGKQIGLPENIRNASQLLSMIYKAQKKFENAYEMSVLFKLMADSVNNVEMQKASVKKQMSYEFEKRQLADSLKEAERTAQQELKHQQEIDQQRTYTYGGLCGFFFMIIVSGISFRAYRQKQKSNEIITAQKLVVEEKQKEIMASIRYAKRIQQSLMPTEKYINKNLNRLNLTQ